MSRFEGKTKKEYEFCNHITKVSPEEIGEKMRLFPGISEEISSCFDEGKNIVFLTGDGNREKALILKCFAVEKKGTFDRIIFLNADTGKYYFPGNATPIPDTNDILREHLNRYIYFIANQSFSPFKSRSSETILSELGKGDTLIIIDEAETEFFPKYLEDLSRFGFKILYSARKMPKKSPVLCKEVKLKLPSKDIVSDVFFDSFDGNRRCKMSLCELLGNRPFALFLAKKYLIQKKIGVGELSKRISDVSKEYSLNPKKDYIKIFYFLHDFSHGEKEAFRTLGIFLRYVRTPCDDTEDFKKLFSVNYIEQILDKPFEKWKSTVTSGFFKFDENGILSTEKDVLDFVTSFLKPTASSCPCFMKYISRKLDFRLSQKEKNLCANVKRINSNESSDLIFLKYMPDVYAYFSVADNNRTIRLYNLVTTYCLTLLGTRKTTVYTSHLNQFGNIVLLSFLLNSYDSQIYDNSDDGEMYDKIYTCRVKFLLDIIRICVSFIRFSSNNHAYQKEFILSVLYDVIKEITSSEKNTHSNVFGKVLLYGDVLRLCEESFFFFSDISFDGTYHNERCSKNSVIDYFENSAINQSFCSSVYPLGSTLSFRLYAKLQNLAISFLELSDKTEIPSSMAYYHSSLLRKKAFVTEFSYFYHRIILGFDTFFDFYDDKYIHTDVESVISQTDDETLSALLKKAEQTTDSLFDRNGKNSILYAKQLISTVKDSKNAFKLSLLALSEDFPISHRCRLALSDLNFAKTLFSSPYIDTTEAESIVIHCTKELTGNTTFLPLCESIVYTAESKFTLSQQCLNKAYGNICFAYIKEVCDIAGKYVDENNTPIRRHGKSVLGFKCLTEELFLHFKSLYQNSTSHEQYLANVIYTFKYGLSAEKVQSAMQDAFLTLIYTRLRKNDDFSRSGLSFIIKLFFENDVAKYLIDELTSSLYSPNLTLHQAGLINKYMKKE